MDKQTYLIIVIIFLLSLEAIGQDQHIVLNQPIIGGQHTYTAIESISMVPGFSYKPLTTNDFFIGSIGAPQIEPPMAGIYGGHPNNDHGGVVGSLTGNLMVSSTGAAVYNIPIDVPPGIAGMEPQLALIYNSQGGNGLLGQGWGLSGLSSITRTGKTLYHDGKVKGILFGGDDRYVLDGQRLISVGGNEYRTEVESFSKITAHGYAGDGPEWFKVQTKTGQTLYYGTTTNGRVEATGRSSVLTWHLCKIEDFMGNMIEFDYYESGGMGRIKAIKYGGNSSIGQGHINELRFNYEENRPDRVRHYIAGSYINLNHLLTNISVYANSQHLYTYTLNYESVFVSRLKKVWINDASISENYYNPMDFDWGQDYNHEYHRKIVNKETPHRLIDHYFLDINGDGMSDVIRIEYVVESGAKKALNWYFRLRNPDDTWGPKKSLGSIPEYYENLIVADFNGDNLDDFVVVRYTNANQTEMTINQVFLSNSDGFHIYGIPAISGLSVNLPEFRIGDFNGNGKNELLVAYKSKDPSEDNVFIWRFNESPPYSEVVFWGNIDFGNKDHNEAEIIVADFTGNGRSDVLRTAKYHSSPNDVSNCFIYSVDLDIRGFKFVYGDGYPTVWHKVFSGDFNGDGITDILTYNYTAANPTWTIGYFKGNHSGFVGTNIVDLNGFNHYLYHFDPSEPNLERNHAIVISDFNGDGKHDIMQLTMILDQLDPYKACCDIYYSNGERFEKKTHFFSGIDGFATVSSRLHNHMFPKIDLNGDGKSDIFLLGVQSIDYEYFLDADNDLLFLNSFTDGFGKKSQVLYTPLTNQNIYSKGNTENYPLLVIQPPLYVVTSVFNEINGNLSETETYNYEGALYHKHGKGFLGFKKRSIHDKLSGIMTQSMSSLFIDNGKYYYPFISSNQTFKSENEWITLSEFQTGIKVNLENDFIFHPYILSEFHLQKGYESMELIKSSKVTYQFDDFGNNTLKQILTHPEITGPNSPPSSFDHQLDITTIYYPPNYNDWILSRPDIITSSARYKNNPPIISANKHYYNGTSPLVQMVEFRPNGQAGDPLLTRKHFTYNAVGNVKTTTVTAPNFSPAIEPRITIIDYSADYRFPEHLHDQMDYTLTTQFDTHYGWKNSTTNTNDIFNSLNPVVYIHDPLGIFSSVAYPDNNIQISVLRWAKNHPHAPENALYYSWEQSSGQSELLVFYNNSGQELRTATKSFDGSWVYVDKLYNDRALLSKESMPYFANESPHYTNYSYDAIGRLKTITYPDGTSTIKTYQNNTITTTNQGGQNSIQAYNAAGWLIESTDDQDTKVKYDYFSDGNLKTTHIVGLPQTTLSMEYNSRRQRSLLNDPNYGQTTYIYNPFDELVEQLSPKGQITSYSYDLLGRMESMISSEGQVQWNYDQTPGRIGTLHSVQGPGHQTDYTYDNHLRSKNVTETINETIYQTHFTYDELGRLETTIYPSGFAIRNEYNSRGYLRRISATDNSLLWQTDNTNALGLLTEYRTGNLLKTTKTYEPLTNRLSHIKTVLEGQTPVQDLGYTWYDVGNLKQRSCSRYSLFEFFTYDRLNRLETIRLNGTIRGEHNYDTGGLGNLTYKKSDSHILFDNAAYGENNCGPHALTSVEATAGIFPVETQTMSYNSFDKITSITEGNKTLQITYGHHRERIEQQYIQGSNSVNKLWAGACEYITKNGQQHIHTYLSGPMGLFAIHIIKPDGTEEINYIHTDHLGS